MKRTSAGAASSSGASGGDARASRARRARARTSRERLAQPVERRDGVRREDGRAAAAERARLGRVGADEGDALGAARRAGAGPSLRASTKPAAAVERSSAATSSSDHGAGVAGSVPSSAPDARRQAQDPQHLLVDRRLAHAPLAHRGDERVAPRAGRPGHREVERRAARRLGRARRVPVGHDEPSQPHSPLRTSAQHRALGHRRAVDAVVGGHHRPRVHGRDDVLERRQVELAQRPLGDPRVEREALGLGVVGDEVLDGGGDALRPAARARRRRRSAPVSSGSSLRHSKCRPP